MQQVIKPLTVRSAQPHINTQQVQAMPMLCVPIEDQKKFREFVEQSDKSKFELQQSITRIDNLIKSLIQGTEN
jgi:type I restriction enzyme S subunit